MVKNIVTVGGGTGTPVVNEALLLAGVKYISSIVTVMDSGGATGRMRTDSRGQEIAYSDAMRSLLSLISPREKNHKRVLTLNELLRKRDGELGRVIGYEIFSQYYHQLDGFKQTQKLLENLTGINFYGEVIPVTLESTNIVLQTVSGEILHGEHELDNRRMSPDMVTKIWLDPKAPASPKSLAALSKADLIIFSCGSWYGSVLVNLLPRGIKEALKKSSAKKILLTNLASTRSETHNYRPVDFIKCFQKYTGIKKPLDYLLIPNFSRQDFERKYPQVVQRYSFEHSHFLGWDTPEIIEVERLGVKIMRHDALSIDPIHHRIRHDPKMLAKALRAFL